MSFVTDNRAFEAWLKKQCKVVKEDLEVKHERMKTDAFVFLRATFFRWARKIESICSALAEAPAVLSVGDLHLENFGTWHDAQGRLIWGVNDFDEAAVIPYTFDLLRLATSIHLARDVRKGPKIAIGDRAASKAILKGYRRGIQEPKPTVLDEKKIWMRPLVDCTAEDRAKFWREIGKLRPQEPPHKMRKTLKRSLPEGSPAPEGRRRPGPAALCRASGVVRRTYPARGKGAGALGLGLGAPRPEPEIAIPRSCQWRIPRARPLSAYPGLIHRQAHRAGFAQDRA
jgi:hypothetical protein